jgi:thiol-disulfide isomerase/thioredoxin
MKNAIINLVLFLSLAVAMSGLTACGDKVSSDNGANPNTNNAGSPLPQTGGPGQGETKSSGHRVAPSFITEPELKLVDGGTFKVQDRKGQVVLLNLWATWCGPCRGEMPELVAMQNKYSDKNFKVVGLNIDNETVDEIKGFAKDMKLNYELAWVDRKTADEYLRFSQFAGIPQTFLVDREGNLRGVFTGGGPKVIAKMKETVDQVVNE